MTISIKSIGGTMQEAPVVTELKATKNITQDSIEIQYKVIDEELQIVRHYLTVKSSAGTVYNKKEITKEVHYESPNNIFTCKIQGLKRGTDYTIQIECFDGLDYGKSDAISVSTQNINIFGVRVMENNSNPQSCVSYIEGAIGVSPATPTGLGGWSNKFPFNKVRIVGLKNGRETGDINPFNKNSYTNGGPVPSDVDIMSAIPKFYWKFSNIDNGYELRISDSKLDDGYDCPMHKVGGVEKDFVYIACYLGSEQNGKMRSLPNVNPVNTIPLTRLRELAQSNGQGYQSWNWYSLQGLLILYLISYKNLDSLRALGAGVVDYNVGIQKTGFTSDKGLNYGTQSQSQSICFLGIEDFWGNLFQWVDGICLSTDYRILVTQDNKTFNNTGSGFESLGKFFNYNEGGFMSKVAHTNKACFLPTEFKGSQSTYYTDKGDISTRSSEMAFGYSGGCLNYGDTGAFSLHLDLNATSLGYSVRGGSRLCYLG